MTYMKLNKTNKYLELSYGPINSLLYDEFKLLYISEKTNEHFENLLSIFLLNHICYYFQQSCINCKDIGVKKQNINTIMGFDHIFGSLLLKYIPEHMIQGLPVKWSQPLYNCSSKYSHVCITSTLINSFIYYSASVNVFIQEISLLLHLPGSQCFILHYCFYY